MTAKIYQDGNPSTPYRRVTYLSDGPAYVTSTTSTSWTATSLSFIFNPATTTSTALLIFQGQLAVGLATVIRDYGETVHMFDPTWGGARNENSTLCTLVVKDVPGTTSQVRYRVYIRSISGATCYWNNQMGLPGGGYDAMSMYDFFT